MNQRASIKSSGISSNQQSVASSKYGKNKNDDISTHEKALEALRYFTQKQEDVISKNAELLKQF